MCLGPGRPQAKGGFLLCRSGRICSDNLCMFRAEVESSGCHWQTESNVLMETCWVMIYWVLEREQESRRSAERWSISPINIYCTPSQQPALAVSVCVTGTVVEITLTLYMDRLLEPLRSDFNHILCFFFLPLQEWDTVICEKFSPTHFLDTNSSY